MDKKKDQLDLQIKGGENKENIPPNYENDHTKQDFSKKQPSVLLPLRTHVNVEIKLQAKKTVYIPPLVQESMSMQEQETIEKTYLFENKFLDESGMEVLDSLHMSQQLNHPENCLSEHTITPSLRAKMVNWMIEVVSSYSLSCRCFFLSVALMDNYYLKTSMHYDESDIHLTGVTCMYLASKIEEIKPLNINVVHRRISHGVLSVSSIKRKEIEIVQALDYNLIFTTAIQLLEMYIELLRKKFQGTNEVVVTEVLKKLKKDAIQHAIMASYDYGMLTFFPSTIAGGSIYASALKLSQEYHHNNDELLMSFLKELTCEEEQNVNEMEDCAKKLWDLKSQFDKKYSGLANVFIKVMNL